MIGMTCRKTATTSRFVLRVNPVPRLAPIIHPLRFKKPACMDGFLTSYH